MVYEPEKNKATDETKEQEAAHLLAVGDSHFTKNMNTPLRKDAFDVPDEEKIKTIAEHFRQIMETLGLDLQDDSLRGTPLRVAKMYVQEIFAGLNPQNKPSNTLFDNKYGYQQMLIEKDIAVFSTCEHHFLPIYGKAHIAYISSGKVIGLSKINRIVQHCSKRPQVQERLTKQIAQELKAALQSEDVAVVVDAAHQCVHARGVEDRNSSTVTFEFSGRFLREDQLRNELLHFLK